jgi:lysozyme
MKYWGADFTIIRAGQNLWIDPDFSKNWSEAKKSGILRGAYYFFDPRVSPKAQAKLFCDLVKNDPPEGRMWIDLEFPSSWGGEYTNWTNWKIMCEEVKRISGLRVGIYTGAWWWNTHLQGIDLKYFTQYPLWEANYTDNPIYVKVSKGWDTCLLWQKGTPPIGIDVGVESIEVDYNWFNGDLVEFQKEFGNATQPPIPPTQNTYPIINSLDITLDSGEKRLFVKK